MKGKAKLVRNKRDGTYKVFAKKHFWEKYKPLFDNNGILIEFKTFKEFGKITKIESFGTITLQFDDFQGM